MRLKLVLALLLAALSAPAAAQRVIPQDAQRAVLRVVSDMVVDLNGEQRVLAPGVLIRDPMNMLMLPGALPPRQPLLVRVRFDPDGTVRHVWILTPEEIAAAEREPQR